MGMLIFYWPKVVNMCVHSDRIHSEEDYSFAVSKCVYIQYGWIDIHHRIVHDRTCIFTYITGAL